MQYFDQEFLSVSMLQHSIIFLFYVYSCRTLISACVTCYFPFQRPYLGLVTNLLTKINYLKCKAVGRIHPQTGCSDAP